jgi:hypothetical protein
MEIDKTKHGWWNKQKSLDKTHCSKGHELTQQNVFTKKTQPGKFCKACSVVIQDKYREKRRVKRENLEWTAS